MIIYKKDSYWILRCEPANGTFSFKKMCNLKTCSYCLYGLGRTDKNYGTESFGQTPFIKGISGIMLPLFDEEPV